MKIKVFGLVLLTLFSCNYAKKRAIKDGLIKAYTLEIELLESEIEEERLTKDMRINEYKFLLNEKSIYNLVIHLKKRQNQITEEYKSKYDQLDTKINNIKKQISDSAIYIGPIEQKIVAYKNKLELIKENKFDYDTELDFMNEINKRTEEREIKINEKISERKDLMADREKRINEMKLLQEEIVELKKN